MPVQFNIDSRHAEDARFKKVLFGYDGKLLEVELNELQDIFNARRSQLIDKLFGSRPLYTGTYTYANGTLTIANEVVVMNRELILIPSISVAVASGETVYLNLQEKTITKSDTIKKNGLITSAEVITNYLEDPRLGEETTRRVQVTYQLTKTNVGNGTFLKLCAIQTGAVVKNTADYPDSDLYREVRRLASEVIASSSINADIAAAKKRADDAHTALATHESDTAKHVTSTERTAWNAKETPEGAAAKVKVTQDDLNSHKGSRGAAHAVATTSEAGFMSATDKTKLDGVAAGANNYVHPSSHPASIITQDASNRFVSDTEKATWNGKASTAVATTAANGLMSASDKTKLDGIAAGAQPNQNTFSTVVVGTTSVAADSATDTLELVAGTGIVLAPDATNDKVTFSVDSSIETTSGAQSKANAAETAAINWAKSWGLGTIAKSATDLNAITGESGFFMGSTMANAPTTTGWYIVINMRHNTTYGTQLAFQFTDSNNPMGYQRQQTNGTWTSWKRFASDSLATTSVHGLMSSNDKSKLDGIEAGATNYVHPLSHPASIITQDASNRFVTDTEKAIWNGKASTALATSSAHGLMSNTDKTKLDGIAAGAQTNQNAFSTVKVGTTNVAADSATDTLELVGGDGITLTPDATNDKVTFKTDPTVTTKAATAAPGTYPLGLSVFSADSSYPTNTATIYTIMMNADRCIQYCAEKSTLKRIWYRMGDGALTNGWSPWVELTTSSNSPKVTVSSTAPSNPSTGDLWIW